MCLLEGFTGEIIRLIVEDILRYVFYVACAMREQTEIKKKREGQQQ